MKKSTLLLMLLQLFIASAFAGTIQQTYYFDSPSIKNAGDFQLISFDNTMLTGRTGEPALPYQSVSLLLPPGEEAIAVNYLFEDESNLTGSFRIYPQQPSRPLSEGPDGIFHMNSNTYTSSEPYPAQAWGEFSTQFLNGHSFILATFTPVKYIPASGAVSFFKKVTVSVETRKTSRAGLALENLNTCLKVNDRVRLLAQNAQMIVNYPVKASRDDGYDILIITPFLLEGQYLQLKALYLIRGLKAQTTTTEYISNNISGMDMPEKIRNYIIQEYQNNGIEYVLLGGDVEYIPARGFYCYVISGSGYEDYNIPSDLYYSALDGNWNTDNDDMWGEPGEDDLLPDVAVARFPVSTVTQLQRIIHKSISYQDTPVQGELRNPIMAGEELWSDPLTFGEDYLELLIGYQNENGYVTDGIPDDYNFTRLYDHLNYWYSGDLVEAINQGASFVHHSGHANQTYVMRLDISEITDANFFGADGVDHNYTLIYTHGCLCGAFDESDCIGEAMVCIDNFAAAGAFNSRYGWFNEGQTEGPSAHLHREFVDALYTDKECRIGAAHMISKIATSPWVNAPGQWEEGALRWCFYCCNILGDPAMGVWTDEPITIETDYPEEIVQGTTSVTVTVTSNGQPVEGFCCNIMSGGNMLGCAETGASGQAVIQIDGGFYGVPDAELVVSGYNCLPNHYPLSILVGTPDILPNMTSFNVLPNPFSDQVKLSFRLDQPETLMIGFYLPSGQKLDELYFSGKEGLNQLTLSTSSWPQGVIITQVISGNKVINFRMIHLKK